MITNVTLPQWLDDLIFNELGAKYCRSNSDMTVIDWDRNDILNYLGTYFPRSYAEAYGIFKEYISVANPSFLEKDILNIFDFGCGTGGQLMGFISALCESPIQPKCIHVFGLDGNDHALRICERIIAHLQEKSITSFDIVFSPIPYTIEDFYDLSLLKNVIPKSIDLAITFKAICEFVTKENFDKENPYKHITNFFLPYLSIGGVVCLVDVTSYNGVSQEWLPIQMDKGIFECSCNVQMKNVGYNQSFLVSHSRKNSDVSKISWRIITNKN